MTPEQVAATDVSRSDRRLTLALGYVGQLLNLPIGGVNFEQVGSTDSESFARRRIPSITIHSLTQKNFNAGILHSSKDKLSVIQLDDYYETYRLLALYLVYLDHFLNAPEILPTRGP